MLPDKTIKPITLKFSLGLRIFDYDEIIMIEADGNCSLVYTIEKEKAERVVNNLSYINKNYCNKTLYRCHRSYIINLHHVEELLIKSREVQMKNNLRARLSERCLKEDKENAGNKHTLTKHKNKLMINLLSNPMNNDKHIRSGKKNIFFRKQSCPLCLILLFFIMVFVHTGCEDIDRFYRPDLAEKLCCIGIIDADNTMHDSLLVFPYRLNSNLRNISFEKSYQSEYTSEITDSLRGFSFSISTPEDEEIISYGSDSVIKELRNFKIPDGVEFHSGVTYYLNACEDNTPEITAKFTVPEPPPMTELISYSIERTTLSEPQPCTGITDVLTAVLNISFTNQSRNNYYAILLIGEGHTISSSYPDRFNFLDFSVRESNTQVFFSIMHGLEMDHYACDEDRTPRICIKKSPVYACFFESSKTSGEKYYISLSTRFSDERCVYFLIESFRIILLSIPEELYYFQKSLYTYDRVSDDPFSEPVYLNGNIEGGNGIFAICRSEVLIVDINMEDYFF